MNQKASFQQQLCTRKQHSRQPREGSQVLKASAKDGCHLLCTDHPQSGFLGCCQRVLPELRHLTAYTHIKKHTYTRICMYIYIYICLLLQLKLNFLTATLGDSAAGQISSCFLLQNAASRRQKPESFVSLDPTTRQWQQDGT